MYYHLDGQVCYRGFPVSTVFWSMRFCTIKGIALIGEAGRQEEILTPPLLLSPPLRFLAPMLQLAHPDFQTFRHPWTIEFGIVGPLSNGHQLKTFQWLLGRASKVFIVNTKYLQVAKNSTWPVTGLWYRGPLKVLNCTKLTKGISWSHFESVWNHSGPSEVPYFTNQ